MSNPNPLISDGAFKGFVYLNSLLLTDTCTIYNFIKVFTDQGNEQNTFSAPITNVPCRMDDDMSARLIPQRSKEDIDVEKVMRTIYLPLGTVINIKDELETSAGQPDGSIVRYRVVNTTLETDELEIPVLIELAT